MGSQMTSPPKKLGSWEGRVNNTIYQAATDGFVAAYGSTTTPVFMRLKTSSGPIPTTTISEYRDDDGNTVGSVFSPIRKGDYWKTENATTVFWIPYS